MRRTGFLHVVIFACSATPTEHPASEAGARDSDSTSSTANTLLGSDTPDAAGMCALTDAGTASLDASQPGADAEEAGSMTTDSTVTIDAALERDAAIGPTNSEPRDAAYPTLVDNSEPDTATSQPAASDAAAGSDTTSATDGATHAQRIDVLSACDDDGVSDVDTAGVCTVNWASGAGIGIVSALAETGRCEGLSLADGLELQLRIDDVELNPDSALPGNVVALYPATVLNREPQCNVLLEWNSLAAIPSLVTGQLVDYTQRQVLFQDGVAAGFTQLRDEAGTTLFAQYSGPPTLHAEWGVPDFSTTWLAAICQAPFSDVSNPVTLHAVSFEGGDDACRLDAGSWACCEFWQQQYRIYLQATSVPDRESLSYTISRADFFVAAPTLE